jgi:hypothetical protein
VALVAVETCIHRYEVHTGTSDFPALNPELIDGCSPNSLRPFLFSVITAQPPLGEVVPNPKGFQSGLFGPWRFTAKISNDRSPIPKPFGFSMETDSNSMAEQILSIYFLEAQWLLP